LLDVSGDLRGNLGGHNDLRQVQETPAPELGAVAQIQVFGQCRRRPATRFLNAGHAPHARRSTEIQKQTAPGAGGLLDYEVTVQIQRLGACQRVFSRVQVPPARLHHAQPVVGGKQRHHALQKIGRGDKIGIKYGSQLGGLPPEALIERAGLIARAGRAANVLDIPAKSVIAGDMAGDQIAGFVRRIIEHLDMQPVARVIQRHNRLDQAGDNRPLVINRQLHKDMWPIRRRRPWQGRAGAPLPP